jgi:lycopene cyclase domain-containing protein
VSHLAYLGVLVFCVVGTLPLELCWPRTRVYARLRRLGLSLAPVLGVFVAWDLYAIAQGHWEFDRHQTLGVLLPGRLPVEEALFFVIVPICAVLALEAVRRATGWRVGDER